MDGIVLAEGPFMGYPQAESSSQALNRPLPSMTEILETYQSCANNLELCSSCLIYAVCLISLVTILTTVLIVKLFTVWNES